MKKITFLFIVLIFISSCDSTITKVCFDYKCFNVELADTEKERKAGLMNRNYLPYNGGMLFIFDKEGYYSFWMKDTLIPLDIIWINNNEIVYIQENAEICKQNNCETFTPNEKANYVLEINSGLIKELNLKIGDKVNL